MQPMETNYQKEGNKLRVKKNTLIKGVDNSGVCRLLVADILLELD